MYVAILGSRARTGVGILLLGRKGRAFEDCELDKRLLAVEDALYVDFGLAVGVGVSVSVGNGTG